MVARSHLHRWFWMRILVFVQCYIDNDEAYGPTQGAHVIHGRDVYVHVYHSNSHSSYSSRLRPLGMLPQKLIQPHSCVPRILSFSPWYSKDLEVSTSVPWTSTWRILKSLLTPYLYPRQIHRKYWWDGVSRVLPLIILRCAPLAIWLRICGEFSGQDIAIDRVVTR